MKSWDGTLSPTEFYGAALVFSDLRKRFNSFLPHWIWVPSPKRSWVSHGKMEGYLLAGNVILPKSLKKDDWVEEEESTGVDEYEFRDTAELVQDHGSCVHRYDFHVVYSTSYRVPALYFHASRSDGQPLELEAIEKDIPLHSAQLLTKSKWTFITQEEHPILNRPWYTLHPCGTSEWMKLLLSEKSCNDQDCDVILKTYLVSWFSVVGQVFGLRIPPEMVNLAATL